jgi:disulfide bond formation protein DsbB
MTTSQLSVFFATLSLACWAATVVVVVLAVIRWRTRGASTALTTVFDGIARESLWLAWIVAAVATCGSLYYSLVAHFPPCDLCWYQRICMYPMAAILLIAALRRDSGIWRYLMPQAVIGAVIAVYHTQLQAFPKQSSFCSTTNPCTARYVWEFGFVSLPFMDLAALGFIIAMLLVATTAGASR